MLKLNKNVLIIVIDLVIHRTWTTTHCFVYLKRLWCWKPSECDKCISVYIFIFIEFLYLDWSVMNTIRLPCQTCWTFGFINISSFDVITIHVQFQGVFVIKRSITYITNKPLRSIVPTFMLVI